MVFARNRIRALKSTDTEVADYAKSMVVFIVLMHCYTIRIIGQYSRSVGILNMPTYFSSRRSLLLFNLAQRNWIEPYKWLSAGWQYQCSFFIFAVLRWALVQSSGNRRNLPSILRVFCCPLSLSYSVHRLRLHAFPLETQAFGSERCNVSYHSLLYSYTDLFNIAKMF